MKNKKQITSALTNLVFGLMVKTHGEYGGYFADEIETLAEALTSPEEIIMVNKTPANLLVADADSELIRDIVNSTKGVETVTVAPLGALPQEVPINDPSVEWRNTLDGLCNKILDCNQELMDHMDGLKDISEEQAQFLTGYMAVRIADLHRKIDKMIKGE